MAEDIRSLYVTALQNTHGIELQALQIMERQVERLRHYPQMEQALRHHIEETHHQRDRLEEALSELAEKPAVLKEGFLGMVGNLMALGHTPAQDEVLKNAFANQAFENFEIAAYRALLVFGDAAGQSKHSAAFEQSLSEEERMAQTIASLVQPTTKSYIELTLAGQKADR
jgi:ferritin-like metal-binding protein YciE